MLEKALLGSKKYYTLLAALLGLFGIGFLTYLYQLNVGLGITGMSRDVSWGFYIAQFTYFVGVAASAVMVVLPYYLHDYKAFGKITILGEFLAIGAVIMCITFVTVDLGQPMRLANLLFHPSPNSILFWDILVLNGYLFLNLIIGWTTLSAEHRQVKYARWVKPLIYLSIPWAVSIHTVTAFIYAGLPGRHLWLTAIMAARFLTSAFAAGPAILLILIFILRKYANFDVGGKRPIQTLAKVITYAMIINVFFYLLEFFTAFYSQIPGHMHSLEYLFFGSHGHYAMVPWMWFSVLLSIIALVLLLVPQFRQNEKLLLPALILIVLATWIDKGLALTTGGFIPNPFDRVTEYTPTIPEIVISLGIYGLGFFIITVLYKIVVSIRKEA